MMKTIAVSTALSVALWTCGSQAAIKLHLTKTNEPTTLSQRHILPRQNSKAVGLMNNVTGGTYVAKVAVGTPPQELHLLIDTGSSDTWFTDATTPRCTDEGWFRMYGGACIDAYTANKSSTYKLVHENEFNVTYAGGNFARGDYISDDIQVGGLTVKGQTLGLGKRVSYWTGLMGLGYTLTVSSNAGFDDTPFTYPTLLDSMFDQGLINLKAYSLYLNSKESKTGSIIFGGMDTDKYIGDLVQMPVITRKSHKGTQVYDHLTVAMTGMSLHNGTVDTTLSTTPYPVLLDSGTTLTYLPDSIASQIFLLVGATDDTKSRDGWSVPSGFVYVWCDIVNHPDVIFTYTFGDSENSVEITVQLSDLVYPLETIFGSREKSPYPDDTGDGICVFGLNPSINGMAILGDTFLRSAYVVYDMSNNVIAMAQMNPNSITEEIVDFKESDVVIPGVSKIATKVEVVQTATFYGGVESVMAGTRVRNTQMPTSTTWVSSMLLPLGDGGATATSSPSPGAGTGAGGRVGVNALMVGLSVLLSGGLIFA